MTCRYCGTALPDGALFCGECGQPVSAAETKTAATAVIGSTRPVRDFAAPGPAVVDPGESPPAATGFSIADLAFSSPGETSQPDDDDRELPDDAPLGGTGLVPAASGAHCPQCGEPMAEGDVFCGECGFVARTVSPPAGEGAEPEPVSPFAVVPGLIDLGEFAADPEAPEPEPAVHDADSTTEVEPLTIFDGEPEPDEPDPDEPEPDEPQPDEPEPDDGVSIDDLVLESGPAFAAADPESDPDLEFDDPLPFAARGAWPVVTPLPSPRSRAIPDPFPWGTDQPLREDLEATRLVADSASGTRYVLQFSTGESVTVAGSGLVGRNPSMQPGEYVDQLVPIFDAGKSVSKTHLEFGQEAGRFWVTDRYSTNGSVIRQPDTEPRRCDPGRRYFIARGTRVDVGEQFFVVS